MASAWVRVFAQAASVPRSSRRRSSHPVVLRSDKLEVVLDERDGLPFEFRLPTLNTSFVGEATGEPIRATVCEKATSRFDSVLLQVHTLRHTVKEAEFDFVASVGDKRAASFAIRHQLDGSTLTIIMHSVVEYDGFELIEVAMPSLVTVREEDGAAWVAHGDTGGSLAMLRDAIPGTLKPNRFWGNVLATLPMVMIGNGKAVCVQEVTAFMDGTELRVSGNAGSRMASLGTTKTHRVNGSLCYDMNTGDNDTRNCGKRGTPNLLVGQRSSCRLDFIGDSNGDGNASWLDGAQLVRRRMAPIPKHIYDNAFVYGILCDQPLFEKPTATFEDCETIIGKVADLTDNARQIVHLWGWQFKGKDSGYPAVDVVNPRLGGYEGMMRLMERAKALNCIVTLSDNYDDAYRSSPAWNPDWIARRPDGELWKSRNWTGENSYILGMAKYVEAAGLKRVRYTCERYRLPETTHVDVLSYYSIRNDWDPMHPASGIENLHARWRIVDEFAKHGVDVSSEALRYAFLGKISSFWYMTGPEKDPFGGQPIPLLATIYRKSAVWGQSGRLGELTDAIIKMLFYNGYAHVPFRDASNLSAAGDMYYLMMLPWFHLHGRDIVSFRREGERTFIGLEGNSSIEIDWARDAYTATVDGVEITRDSAIFCPLDDRRIAFYSISPRELARPLPSGWDPTLVTASALSTEGRKRAEVEVKNDMLTVAVKPREPVIVYRDAERAAEKA